MREYPRGLRGHDESDPEPALFPLRRICLQQKGEPSMIEKDIANIVYYAKSHLHLDPEDAVYEENLLLKLFKRDRPYDGEIDQAAIDALAVPDTVIEPLERY